MKNSSLISVLLFFVISFFSYQTFAYDLAWYDQSRQALAVDAYADGWGGEIAIDFNSDHSAAGQISQSLWTIYDGYVTQGGVHKIVYYDWGYTTTYAWGERLGTIMPIYDFSSKVSELYNGVSSPDGFHYFTPEWDVNNGKTVIYVQPIVEGRPIPVMATDLDKIYLRMNSYSQWEQFNGVIKEGDGQEIEPQSCCGDEALNGQLEPVVPEPVTVEVTVSPSVLNNKSFGRWVTTRIELPEPYTVDDVNIDSVVLTIRADRVENDTLLESVALVKKVAQAGMNGNMLIAKFDRSQLMDLLVPGETNVYAHGELKNGTPIRGVTMFSLNY